MGNLYLIPIYFSEQQDAEQVRRMVEYRSGFCPGRATFLTHYLRKETGPESGVGSRLPCDIAVGGIIYSYTRMSTTESKTKTILLIGVGGSGKSHLIEMLSEGKIKNIECESLNPKFTPTKSYRVGDLEIIDTPGLYNRQKKWNQACLNDIHNFLRQRGKEKGIHRIYFCLDATLSTFRTCNSAFQTTFDLMSSFQDIDSSIFRILVTQMDRVDPKEQANRKQLAKEKSELTLSHEAGDFIRRSGVKVNLLFIGEPGSTINPIGLVELQKDLKDLPSQPFLLSQTLV